MNRFIVVIQDPEGYDPDDPGAKAPPHIHTAILVNDIEEWIDTAIKLWRNTKANPKDSGELEMAVHYVDAFQSARSSILGETLP